MNFFFRKLYSLLRFIEPPQILFPLQTAHFARFVCCGGHFADCLSAPAALKQFALCVFFLFFFSFFFFRFFFTVLRSLFVKKLVFLVQTVSMGQVGFFLCVFFFFSPVCARWRICRQGSFVTLISDLSCRVQQAAPALI